MSQARDIVFWAVAPTAGRLDASEPWGFHDDHREKDGTPEYRPALQQVRSEFYGLLDVLESKLGRVTVGPPFRGRALQLGVGAWSDKPHSIWNALFENGATSIDHRALFFRGDKREPGLDTIAPESSDFAAARGPYTFLLIDAGHGYYDVMHDHRIYGNLVSPGGIIAFHDALRRPGFEEVEVWRYVEALKRTGEAVNIIGNEVGFAWIVKQ